jgi:biotin transport system ATP-binding protein
MPETLFKIEALRKVFPDGKEALAGIDLEIRAGQCLVIAGSNGSGKTLLMRMLVGLAEPSAGRVLFRGADVSTEADRVRRSVGLVFQDADAQVVGETVAEDVAFGPKNLRFSKPAVEVAVSTALAATGLTDKRDAPPRRLSGGEKRRLAVAGVLAMGCEVVVMDEPFANLDWPGVVQVLTSISALKESGKTIVVLTHELEKVLALADRLVILDKGRVRDDGEPQSVLDRGVAAYGVRDPRQTYAGVEDCSWLA